MLPMIIEKHLRTWEIKCWEIWNSETRFESLNCPWLPSHRVWIMLQKCSWEILLGKQLIPWERSTNMQMRFMTWSACLKGLCVTSRHFHQAEKKEEICRKKELWRRKLCCVEDDTSRSAHSLPLSDCRGNMHIEAACASGMSAVRLM